MYILAIDPGENIGYGIINYDLDSKIATVVQTGIVRTLGQNEVGYAFYRFAFDKFDLDFVVLEDYVINPKVYQHDHQGDKGLTLRQIGAVELLSYQHGVKLVKQMPTVKPVGYGFLGRKYQRGKKEMHGWDALAHAEYFLVTVQSKPPFA